MQEPFKHAGLQTAANKKKKIDQIRITSQQTTANQTCKTVRASPSGTAVRAVVLWKSDARGIVVAVKENDAKEAVDDGEDAVFP
jgi:hypothetical protein